MAPAYRQLLARLAAPAAFLLAATIAVLLIRSALHAGDAPSRHDATPSPARHTGSRPEGKKPPKRRHERRRQARVYDTIETGDTLETLAAEHSTSVQRLLELNPGIDPHSLHVGQRVRVR